MSHITYERRYTISCMLKEVYNQSKIGKSKLVMSRGIERNKDQHSGEYRHDLVHENYCKRKAAIPTYSRFTDQLRERVELLLNEDYSTEQIVGTLWKQGKDCVSHETICQHIWDDKKQNGDLCTHLRRQGRNYRKRGNSKDYRGIIKHRVGIDKRPEILDLKDRFCDLEVDLIIGRNHNQAIVTINDRASGVLKMKRVESKKATVVSKAINELLDDWAPYIHTITSDNGQEFAVHKTVAEKLYIDYYFACPYHSWERGANENLNGLVRQYIPKKSDFSILTDEYIKKIETKINNSPRKRFNSENPIFIMEKILFNDKVAFVT